MWIAMKAYDKGWGGENQKRHGYLHVTDQTEQTSTMTPD
jgi:hypothetical protein